MLAKYWRLRMHWDADQTLSFDTGARVAIRMSPWKFTDGALVYGTTITEDLGFSAGETIADEGQVEGTVIDNTTNLHLGINGYFEMTADVNSTDGVASLYVEESDDNTNWPSDQADFDITTDLKLLCQLSFSTDAEDEDRATNFKIG